MILFIRPRYPLFINHLRVSLHIYHTVSEIRVGGISGLANQKCGRRSSEVESDLQRNLSALN